MSEKKLLVASSHKDEAITKWIRESDFLNSLIDIIYIQELLDNFDIRDKLDKNGPVIEWHDSQGNQYSNNSHYILNRVINIEERLFQNFRKEDQDYAQREFEAYLGFALNAFLSPQNQAINGICERFKTLPQQWQMVKNIKGISIPKYYWGSPGYKFLSDEKNVVHSNIFDCLNWSTHQTYNEQETGFRFVKPNGMPLFVLSIGEKDLITFDEQLSEEQQDRIRNVLPQIRSLFNYFIFELLLFINDDQITFGCINIDVIQSVTNPGFDGYMQKHLVEESSKCLN
ncbi:hypothetical protein [Legionella yabuuchiae]|uniref:hypothetical protein n=1 Tax=Legionella yabuuchiae TaxID=376727 RepID=UPI001054881A|nr:hypothetical protein [Legionella yabuuchiae]